VAAFGELTAGDPGRVGRYRIVARLGAGGMGQVYLGRSPGGRAVAVKVVRPELAGDPEFRRRFAREVAAARRVNGVFTAGVVDADVNGSPAWLATAYTQRSVPSRRKSTRPLGAEDHARIRRCEPARLPDGDGARGPRGGWCGLSRTSGRCHIPRRSQARLHSPCLNPAGGHRSCFNICRCPAPLTAEHRFIRLVEADTTTVRTRRPQQGGGFHRTCARGVTHRARGLSGRRSGEFVILPMRC
jgi:hypothetical protein